MAGRLATKGAIQRKGKKPAACAKNIRQTSAAVPAIRKAPTAHRGQISRKRPRAIRRASRRRTGRTETGRSVMYGALFPASVHYLRHQRQPEGSDLFSAFSYFFNG